MANPYELKARESKAQAIVGYLWAALAGYRRESPELVTQLRAYSTDDRAAVARAAGQHAPSPETWARVLELVELRQQQDAGTWRPDGLSFEDATDTCACPACDAVGEAESGGDGDCPYQGRACYRGRVSGFTEDGYDDEGPRYRPTPCDPRQRAAVDARLALRDAFRYGGAA